MFQQFQFSEEDLAALQFSPEQEQLIQHHIGQLAEQKVRAQLADGTKAALKEFLGEQLVIQGGIAALTFLLESTKAAKYNVELRAVTPVSTHEVFGEDAALSATPNLSTLSPTE
jgi:tRNA A37 threonylcarbamoyltransferase TsaD